MRIDILTLFPDMFESVLGASMLKRAADPQLHGPVRYHVTDIRQFTTNKHQKVDRPSFGGGPGMVLQCQPVWDAVQAVTAQEAQPPLRILMTPQGEQLTQPMAEELAQQDRLMIIAGHYEGIDERVIEAMAPIREISIGDYILTGGELPAMVLIDAVVRLLSGVLGHEDSAHHDSFSPGAERLLDHPHYTRPRVWQDREVPEILLSGDHAAIEKWRKEQALARTKQRRPDLLPPTDAQGR
jgi:tRNA (guanine37-N1)-methyltransferase